MDIAVCDPWEGFVKEAVRSGRFDSEQAVVEEGLRLLAGREEQTAALRAMISASLATPGHLTDEEIDAALDAAEAQLAREGF